MSTNRRTVILGGEYRRRSLMHRGRLRPEYVGLCTWGAFCVLLGIIVAIINYPAGVLTWLVTLTLGAYLFLPRQSLNGATKVALWARSWRWRSRGRRGLNRFEPGQPARNKKGKSTSGERIVPDWLGQVRKVSVRPRPDSDDSVLVLLHTGSKDGNGMGYATIVLEVLTGAGMDDRDYASFGQFKSVLAQEDSHVGAIEQLERITTASVARHRTWYEKAHDKDAPAFLLESYEEVLDDLQNIGESHRSLLVLRVPFTGAFLRQVRETYGEVNIATRAQSVVLEAQRAAGLGMSHAHFRSAQPLSEAQVAAAIANTFDPRVEIDDTSYTLETCWPTYEATKRHVRVTNSDGSTHLLRTARIERSDLPGTKLEVSRFQNLLVGIYPAVTRTVSVIEELTPGWIAKQQAIEDQTVDRSRVRAAAGRVTDGSEEDQMNASQQRLFDLRQGQGHQGVNFAFHLVIGADDEMGLTKATQRVEAAANEFTRLTWLDDEQDLALVHSMPLCKGIDMRPRKQGA